MSYGTIYIDRLKNASAVNPYIISWKNASTFPYTKYSIKESDYRVKTASFSSPEHLDLTNGLHAILISSPYHENFSGVVLEEELDEDTGLYTYQCQDWSRLYVSKFVLTGNNIQKFQLLRYLLTRGALSAFKDEGKKKRDNYKNILSGLRAFSKYDQSLYSGNVYKNNPFKDRINVIIRDKSFIEVIRAIVFESLGYFDVYFNDRGILQIEPISKKDWENSGLILTNGEYYNRKAKFSTTNAITSVIVNGEDFSTGSKIKTGDVIKLDLSAFFGNLTTSISNPNKNTSNGVSSSNSSSSSNMKNPFNNKNKKIMVSVDGGSAGFKNSIVNLLKKDGWSVTDLGVGPGTHSRSYEKLSSSYAVNLTIYNGADPATIAEPVTGWLKGKHEKYNVQLVQMFDTKDWTNPKGMKPYRYGNFDGYHCKKAWDDNYSTGKVDISNLGSWYKKYYPKVIHVCGPSASEAFEQFKAGGYLKQKGLK